MLLVVFSLRNLLTFPSSQQSALGIVERMRTRTGDAAPLLEVEEDGRSEDGQCKHHRPSISTSSWTRTAGLAVGAVLLILALRAAHEEARRCVRP